MKNADERTERLLTLILLEMMKGKKQEDKAKALNMVGFSNIEIAEILNTSNQSIATYLYRSKKKKGTKKKPKKEAPELN